MFHADHAQVRVPFEHAIEDHRGQEQLGARADVQQAEFARRRIAAELEFRFAVVPEAR